MCKANIVRPQNVESAIMATQGDQVHKGLSLAKTRWAWTERTVWTERMLTALEEGVKGGVWFSLSDKVWLKSNLLASYQKVADNKGAAGVDHVTIEVFGSHLETNLAKVIELLRTDTFVPQAILRTYIPKLGSTEKRPLGIPTVRDRVVQGALRHVMEPIFEKEFAKQSYGFRPNIGCKDALRRLDELLKNGYAYVVDIDLKSYFDTIPHDRLMERLRERIADSRLLRLVESFLKAGIMEGLSEWDPINGVPQGAVLSPLLSNVYLNPLDHEMAEKGYEMLRYADDFVIVCKSQAEAESALSYVRQWCEAAGLALHPTKTRIVDVRTGSFEFLGYSFQTLQEGPNVGRLTRWPRKTSVAKLKAHVRKKTARSAGVSMKAIIQSLNRTLRGWFGYFKHSYHTTFPQLDSWIRQRLRSILRKRMGGRGPARGRDHQRWLNKYFAARGLFFLEEARKAACRSP